MIEYISDVTRLMQDFRRFAYGGTAPDEIDDQLQRIPGSDADILVNAAELMYAHYDLLNAEGKKVMGQFFTYAHHHGWTTFNRGDRSQTIVANTNEDLLGNIPSLLWPEPETNRRNGTDWRTL